MAGLSLKNVKKSFGETQVIHGVDLDIKDGEFVVFVGPSGCGKSTLLRMLAGLEEVTGGDVSIGDQVVNQVAPAKRGVAMVFQTYALYPHMTVYKNMAFGLKQAKVAKDEIDRRVRAAAKVLDITDYLDRQPKALSGGQRQRVAIGRAIVREPEVFLFDEPLSNLDAALRVQTRLEIARLHERLKTTMIYVTHDQVEAMTLADKIVVLRDGRIEQVGSPMDLYEKPQNLFVAGFIGSPKMNFFKPEHLNEAALKSLKIPAGTNALIGVRPEHLERAKRESSSFVKGNQDITENLGEFIIGHMKGEQGTEFVAKLPADHREVNGTDILFKVDPAFVHLFDAETGLRIDV